jgi:pimeloyl-ACP methyl ester carboxylesterase
MQTLSRRIIDVHGRRVNAWLGGAGPVVLLIHGSPGNSTLVLGLARRLAARFTVLAPDTPGFGDSEPLRCDTFSVGVLADAYAELLAVLAPGPVLVYGTHTGAAIALELVRRHTPQVSGFVLDGVPIFTEQEQRALVSSDYMPALEIDDLGGHYAHTWTRFHDQFVWFPWYRRVPAQLNPADGGTPEAIHDWVTMYFQCAANYHGPYSAAIRYGDEAVSAVRSVRAPGVFLAHEGDMLFPHLDRLPALRDGQRIERVHGPWSAVDEVVEHALTELASGTAVAQTTARAAPVADRYVDGPHGQTFWRERGGGSSTVVLLHDAPGAGGSLDALADALAVSARVLVPDLPGSGRSDPLPADGPLEAYAASVAAALADIDAPITLYGVGAGAALAIELARSSSVRTARLYVDDLRAEDGDARRRMVGRLAPPITIEHDGAHWYRLWYRLRRSLISDPWFDARQVALRRRPESFGAKRLHAWTCDVMRQHAAAHHLVDAVLRWSPPSAADARVAVQGENAGAARALQASLASAGR